MLNQPNFFFAFCTFQFRNALFNNNNNIMNSRSRYNHWNVYAKELLTGSQAN